MAGDELNAYLQQACPKLFNEFPFSDFTRLFIWLSGAGGWTWHRESQDFGHGVQNSSFNSNSEI
jgi:hypothetical protein